MCKWMREERNADSGTPHFKLGFLKLAKRADAHCANKHSAVRVLRHVSNVCETLVLKCDAHKALIVAIDVQHVAFDANSAYFL